jgi:hypothetical protein
MLQRPIVPDHKPHRESVVPHPGLPVEHRQGRVGYSHCASIAALWYFSCEGPSAALRTATCANNTTLYIFFHIVNTPPPQHRIFLTIMTIQRIIVPRRVLKAPPV